MGSLILDGVTFSITTKLDSIRVKWNSNDMKLWHMKHKHISKWNNGIILEEFVKRWETI